MCKKVTLFAAVILTISSLHAGNINFADSNVKALCIQHWDGNGDGELSTDEAANVKTLNTVFRQNTSIVAFDELQFFTGLTSIDDYAFYKSTLQRVTMPESVTAIGEYAFSGSDITGELQVPGTVKSIGDYAFYNCDRLTSVILEEGVQTVGWHSFSGPIRTLVLPSTLTYMSSMAIDPYVNADPSAGIFVPEGDLYVYARGNVPAAINSFAFYNVFSAAHLVVPFGTIDAYKAASGWSQFGEYLEFGDVNADGFIDVADFIAVANNILGQTQATFVRRAADIDYNDIIDVNDFIGVANLILSGANVSDAPKICRKASMDR